MKCTCTHYLSDHIHVDKSGRAPSSLGACRIRKGPINDPQPCPCRSFEEVHSFTRGLAQIEIDVVPCSYCGELEGHSNHKRRDE